MRVFFDSSALAKRYVAEDGTDEVLAWCERADELVIAVIAVPELVSAFRRLQRERRITEAQYLGLKGDLMADLADAVVIDTSPQVVQRAVHALQTHPLRAMDAIHVAAALVCDAEAFVSADPRQCQAAMRLGLNVIAL